MTSVSYWDNENNESDELSEPTNLGGRVRTPAYLEDYIDPRSADFTDLYPSLSLMMMDHRVAEHQIESRSYRQHYKPQDYLSDEFKRSNLYRFITDQKVNKSDKRKIIVGYLMLKNWQSDEWKLADMLDTL